MQRKGNQEKKVSDGFASEVDKELRPREILPMKSFASIVNVIRANLRRKATA